MTAIGGFFEMLSLSNLRNLSPSLGPSLPSFRVSLFCLGLMHMAHFQTKLRPYGRSAMLMNGKAGKLTGRTPVFLMSFLTFSAETFKVP